MNKLYLHIGHGKTGTSFVQASLAQSIEKLRGAGIEYPFDGPSLGMGTSNKISGGNGQKILDSPDGLSKWLETRRHPPTESLLASSEWLIHSLRSWIDGTISGGSLTDLETIFRNNGIGEVHVLLFVRDPVDFCASLWQQTVKRHGQTQDLEEFAEISGADHVKLAARICRGLSGHDLFHLDVKNYDAEKGRLLECMEDWLSVERGLLAQPWTATINRSLTLSELEFQRQINCMIGQNELLSNRLVDELPEIKAEHLTLSEQAALKMWADAGPDIAEVNRHLPEFEALGWKDREVDERPDLYAFNADQLALFARIVADMHARIEDLSRKFAIDADSMHSETTSLAARNEDPQERIDTLVAQNEALQKNIHTLAAQNDACGKELRKAYRDPIPHLANAYLRKVHASLRKWRSRR